MHDTRPAAAASAGASARLGAGISARVGTRPSAGIGAGASAWFGATPFARLAAGASARSSARVGGAVPGAKAGAAAGAKVGFVMAELELAVAEIGSSCPTGATADIPTSFVVATVGAATGTMPGARATGIIKEDEEGPSSEPGAFAVVPEGFAEGSPAGGTPVGDDAETGSELGGAPPGFERASIGSEGAGVGCAGVRLVAGAKAGVKATLGAVGVVETRGVTEDGWGEESVCEGVTAGGEGLTVEGEGVAVEGEGLAADGTGVGAKGNDGVGASDGSVGITGVDVVGVVVKGAGGVVVGDDVGDGELGNGASAMGLKGRIGWGEAARVFAGDETSLEAGDTLGGGDEEVKSGEEGGGEEEGESESDGDTLFKNGERGEDDGEDRFETGEEAGDAMRGEAGREAGVDTGAPVTFETMMEIAVTGGVGGVGIGVGLGEGVAAPGFGEGSGCPTLDTTCRPMSAEFRTE